MTPGKKRESRPTHKSDRLRKRSSKDGSMVSYGTYFSKRGSVPEVVK